MNLVLVRRIRGLRLEAVAWVVAGLFVAFGGVVAFFGLFVRPASDDYRLATFTREGGLPGIIAIFHTNLTGRVGNAFLAGLVYFEPELGMRSIGLLSYAGLAAAVGLLSHGVAKQLGARGATAPVLLGLGAAAIILMDQPRAYQTLYWAPGVITHTIPPILLIAMCGMALAARTRRARIAANVTGLAGGLFLGTVSESITLVGLVLGALSAVTYVLVRRGRSLLLTFMACLNAGLCAGLAVIWTTPAGAKRRRDESPFALEVFQDAATMAAAALRQVLVNSAPLAAVAVGLLVGLLVRVELRVTASRLTWLVLCPALAVVGSAFAVQYALRFGYGPDPGWVPYRAWLNFTFVLQLAGVWYGVLLATVMWRQSVRRAVTAAACSVLLVAAVADYAEDLRRLGRKMIVRSVAWDLQAARIERLRDQGQRIVPYRPLQIASLSEPFLVPPAHTWISNSVAAYHRIDRLYPQ
ncbi:hypothetical protein [Nonomuraea africana]|uniref:hypothetical protein n=1 Tax=Nonomuraea africana TaxID=46171 RepID=UPI0033D532A3